MQQTNDATLKVRLPSELKGELKKIARRDPDTDSLSEWVRREVLAGLQISRKKLDTD